MSLRIHLEKVGLALAVIALCLAAAHLGGQYAKYELGHDHLLGFVGLTDLDNEANLPVWFASTMLLTASILLAAIACLKRKAKEAYVFHWAGLSMLFLLLSVDETAQLHEKLSGLINRFQNPSGVFLYAWTIPAGAAVLVFAVVYLKFFFRLPKATRVLFFLAAALFVGGALGMEMVEGLFVTRSPDWTNTMSHAVTVAVEEFLELSGVALFVYALLAYLKTEYETVQVKFEA